MAILLYEGWDIHAENPGSGIHALGILDWDGNPDWTHGGAGTQRAWDFEPGFSGGQALHWWRNSSHNTLRIGFAAQTELRASFFAKPGYKSTSTHAMLSFQHTAGSVTQAVALRHVGLDGSGQALIGVGTLDGSLENVGTSASASSFAMDDDWAHYEVYLNSTTGAVLVQKDGETVLDETITMLSAGGFINFRIHANGTSNSTWWDHIIITEGESLRDAEGFQAIGVTWTGGGKKTPSNTGIRARITKDATTEYGTTYNMRMAQLDNYAPQQLNSYTEFWMTNPFTSAAWGNEVDIDAWGLCRTDSGGGWLIVAATYLSYIVMTTDGEPVVQYQAPGEALLVDETWVRTHEAVPWHEHVDNYPREMPAWNTSIIPHKDGIGNANPNPFDATASGDSDSVDWSAYEYDDFWYEDYLGCTGPGCISFTMPEIEPHTTYGGTGLAFAEEYRTTYKDWQSIVDGGDDFCSYFITGYKLHGDASKKFQSNYLTVNYQTDILGSAYIQGVWDYALANTPGDAHSRSDTGRWGQTQQIYGVRNDADYKHAFAKLKIRGHGRAMQMKVKCETGKPFWINGWSMFVTGNTTQ